MIQNNYIHLFDTAEQFETAYNGNSYKEPWVSCLTDGSDIRYNRPSYLETIWTENECTNPFPDKAFLVIKNCSYWNGITGEADVSNAPEYISYAYTIDTTEECQLIDAKRLNESLVDNTLEWIYLLWKVTDSDIELTANDPIVMYLGSPGSGDPRWDGTTYWANTTYYIKIGNDYYKTYMFVSD